MHTQICSVNFDLVHGLEGRCHAPPLSGWNLNNHGHDIENNPSQQGLNFRAVSDELPSGNQTWQFTKSPINGGFEWVLGRFGVAMFDSRRGALFQDDSRPGMSRDARAELRVKTVLEEAIRAVPIMAAS